MRSLIIIGNGFDLKCGLESSFKSFFEEEEIEQIKKNGHENFISLLLYETLYNGNTKDDYKKFFNIENLEDFQWVDLEDFIRKILIDKSTQYIRTLFTKFYCNKNENDITETNYLNDLKRFYFNSYRIDKKKKKSFYDFFAVNLRDFESKFCVYLSKQINSNKSYDKKKIRLLEELTEKGKSGTILSFNYTNLPTFLEFDRINVHGRIDNDPIIGIDSKDVTDDCVVFTKTFRKLIHEDELAVLKDNYGKIIIYGHSLGQQDYSYFQSIFDYVDLYTKRTKLVYIYSDDFTNDKAARRELVAKNLYDLLHVYGSSMSNKEHGNNLTHKLLLENRLKLVSNNFEFLNNIV